jgi:hypothetical protein
MRYISEAVATQARVSESSASAGERPAPRPWIDFSGGPLIVVGSVWRSREGGVRRKPAGVL